MAKETGKGTKQPLTRRLRKAAPSHPSDASNAHPVLDYEDVLFVTPEIAFKEAESRIASATRARKTELDLGLSRLERLPKSLARLKALRELSLDTSQVTDLTLVGALTELRLLWLQEAAAIDLSPLAHLTGLSDSAQAESPQPFSGLYYALSRAAQIHPFDRLVNLEQPAATVEIINYLRRQQGLPEHIPAGYAPPDDPFLASLREGKVRPARGESSKEKKPKRERKKQPPKPPEVPPPRPAAVEPVERDGKITLPPEALKADLPSDDLAAALLALKNQIKRVADSARNESNPDRRVIAILDELIERIPASAPPQNDLFELAHEVDTLRAVGQIVNEQWPPALAARFHGLVLSFDRTTRQFPRWREFLRNTTRDTLTPEQVSAAPEAVKTATAELRTDEAAEFIDPRIPAIIDHLVERPHLDLPEPEQPPPADGQTVDPVTAGKEALVADGLESLSNTTKKLSESAVAGWEIVSEVGGEFADGARGKGIDKLKAEARTDGENLPLAAYKWAKRYLVAGSAFAVLATAFPAIFGWLVPILAFFTATGVVVDKRRKRRKPDDGSSGQARG